LGKGDVVAPLQGELRVSRLVSAGGGIEEEARRRRGRGVRGRAHGGADHRSEVGLTMLGIQV